MTTALIAACCLHGSSIAVGAVSLQNGVPLQQAHAARAKTCPDPDAITEALRTGSSAMVNEQYASAIGTLRPLAEASCDPRIALLLAAAYEGTGDVPQAVQTLQRAHTAWGANDTIAASLARLYLGTSQLAEAAKALAAFHATEATPMQEIEVAVLVYLGTHQLPAAVAAAQVGNTAHPSLAALLLLANSMQLEGRYKDVIALLASKRTEYQGSARFLVTLAQSEYDAAMFDVSRADAEQAIRLDPKLYAAHYLLGNVLLKTGSPEGADAEYRVGVQLSPDQPRTYYYLALALRAEHKEGEEEPVLAKAIALDDHYALAHCEMGRILLNQDRVPEAIAQLTRAVQENSANEQGYYLLSRAYERAGKRDQAEEAANRLAAVRKANHSPANRAQSLDAVAPGSNP